MPRNGAGIREIVSKEDLNAEINAGRQNPDPPSLLVVYYYADWCNPCKRIYPTVERWSRTEYSNVRFVKVEVDKLAETTERSGVSAMPTFQLYKGGRKVGELVGASISELQDLIKEHM